MPMNLHDSARDGNLEDVKELLRSRVDVNSADKKYGKTPLCWAAEYGNFEVAEFLLNHGADLALPDLIGRKPLLWASRHGDKRIVQLLLERGDSVESKDKNGRTPLSLAAREGHLDVVRLLLAYGDEVDSQDIKGQSPLSYAAMNGHLEIVLLLLKMGANPDLTESSGNRSPLSFAAENGYIDVVKWLLAKDCNIDSKDSNGRTPLSWAVEYGDEELVEVLLASGADLNSGDKYKRAPISYAAELGLTEVANALLESYDIEFDLRDAYYDQTPLSWAAEGGHSNIVKLLLDMGADADSRDRAGHTPLLWAIKNGHHAVIELLLDEEVEVIVRDEENWTPLSLAAHFGDKLLTQRLLSKAVELNSKVKIAIAEAIEDALWRANESLSDAKEGLDRAKRDPSLNKSLFNKIPLFGVNEKDAAKTEEEVARAKEKLEDNHATVLKHEAVVNLIIENGDYLNIKDYKERTLLSWAAENGHDAVLKLLLQRDLDPNSTDQLNRTPISWAARGGYESTLSILLDQKVHPDWRDGAGRTPLSLAAERGHEAVVKFLMDIDADVKSRAFVLPLDVKKKPAGLYSAPRGSSDNLNPNSASDEGFEGGVDFDSRDFSGQTPLIFAAKEGHGKVVNLLLEKGANIEIKGADNKSLWQIIEDEIQSPETDKFKAANLQDVQMLLESKLADGQLRTSPIKENASADSQFTAMVVQFLQEGRRDMSCQRCNVLDLLKGKVTDEVKPGERITCKWTHVPANNMRWIEIIMANHYKELQDKWKHNIVLKKELWTGLQHRAPEGIHHARFMRPTCQALPIRESFNPFLFAKTREVDFDLPNIDSSASTTGLDQDSEDGLKGLVLFMPYLHWETEDNLEEMKEIIKDYEMCKIGKSVSDENDTRKQRSSDYFKLKDFVKAYLDDKHPLHIRRTLDQYYYHTLKDTDVRDKDQTGSRYHRKFELRNKNIITMVDQLWLWVLPGFGNSPATVITSFPQRSNRVDSSGRRNDEKFTSLFSNIVAQTQDRPVENGHELAEIIASECSRIYFDTMTDRDRSLQFLEIYATSIGEITDKEAQCFDKFQKTLKQPNREDATATAKSTNPQPAKVAEDALSIGEEIKLLQEVKDIRDELNIMLSVFNAQRKALKDMARIMYKTSWGGVGDRRMSAMSSQLLPRVGSWGMDSMAMGGDHGRQHYPLPLGTVEANISEVKDMDKYAERAYMALNHLLDLKQKQANVLEAKATHELTTQAILQGKQTVDLTMATSSQGKMITFFTIITIVFMPLSFMAAFFAINIAEFPRDADGLSLAYVSKYMFLISAAIIGPSIIIAFNLQNIEDFLEKRKNLRVARQNNAPDTGGGPVIGSTDNHDDAIGSVSGSGGESGKTSSTATGTKITDISIHLKTLEVGENGGRKQKLRDEEQGQAPD